MFRQISNEQKKNFKHKRNKRFSQNGDVKLLIEFEAVKNSFNIQTEILDHNVGDALLILLRIYTLQHIRFEKRYNLYVSAPQRDLAILMKMVKQNENILVLNVTEIDF